MHNGFHPKNNVERLYLSSVGGRSLIGFEDPMETAVLGFRNQQRNSKKRLLIVARTIKDERQTPNQYKKRKKNEKKTQWTQKPINGQFIKQTTGKGS